LLSHPRRNAPRMGHPKSMQIEAARSRLLLADDFDEDTVG